jgi:hypothetical protein
MATSDLGTLTADERLIYWAIVLTWLGWLLGALYFVGPLLGWWLAARLAAIWYLTPQSFRRLTFVARIVVGAWIAGVILMLMVLVIGHLNFDLGLTAIVKSSFGWAKGWALFAVFIAIGAAGRVRPLVLIRASNVLALQTLIIAPMLFLAGQINMPPMLYVSPLEVLGGGSAGFFDVDLYVIDPEGNRLRWKFFAPWAPAAALIACLSLALALYDPNPRWRTIGIVSALVVSVMTSSRLALVAVPVILLTVVVLPRLLDPRLVLCAAAVAVAAILLGDTVMAIVSHLTESFTSARASSSRVRSALQSIALHRWWDEAPLFGHGAVERGSHLVEFMVIGSHHNWNGLLFTRGSVGLLCILLPLLLLTVLLLRRALWSEHARAAVVAMVVLVLFSFGENLEILAYIIWPTLVLFGAIVAQSSPSLATASRAVGPLRVQAAIG